MQAITFVTQKGGSGKSTLCISLAVAAREAGLSVCILEMDRQATISDWADHRTADGPEVAQIDATQIDGVMARLRETAYDFVFIDTPGVDSPGTLSAIRAADLCLVPCRPTPADLRAFKPTLAAIYRLEKAFAFVLNQTPARSYRIRDASDGLSVLGVLPDVTIVSRTDHQDAIGFGQGVTEFNPKGQAAAEVRGLWRWIERRMREIADIGAGHVAAA
ncbi:chromosome partitioning protein [Methylobacterium sp. Leaf399]|uniref:ParA family protein n=1 Tax=unclassified Methylobacterium TaxID=2615210 RepID=UPI0006FDEA2D|nr:MULTISPECIES: ParA family protein [unclassified Methylobacterium]KQP48960.1 chromosome partitioning protein [Methylobacterium sp. Leaf108]KQT18844.1 chromosome partitioning protein [Methylobacterium sp. Leaf399]KQT86907.1 chromosome partitioning protein [Methylobacterium sp. Leaf466]